MIITAINFNKFQVLEENRSILKIRKKIDFNCLLKHIQRIADRLSLSNLV